MKFVILTQSLLIVAFLRFCGSTQKPLAGFISNPSIQDSTVIVDSFTVIRLEKGRIDKTDTLVSKACQEWSFEANNINEAIASMKVVSGAEWHAKCYQFRCFYSGIVESSLNLTKYNIEIHAGGYIKIWNKNELLIYISEEPSDFFLQACDCCE